MPGLSFYDKQHIQKVAAQQAVSLTSLYFLFPRISVNGLIREKTMYG